MTSKKILGFAAGLAGVVSTLTGQTDAQVLNRLLRGHFELYGDTADRERIESLSLEGVQIHGDVAHPVDIHKKRPNFMRFRIGTESSYVVVGFNGEQAWREWRTPERDEVEALSDEARMLLREETTFASPLQDWLFDSGVEVTLESRAEVEGEAAYPVLLSVTGHADRRYFISGQSRRLLKVERLDEAGEVVLETFYRDYREVGRYPIAFEIENRTGDGDVVLTRFDAVRVNGGLLSLLFEPPADLEAPERSD